MRRLRPRGLPFRFSSPALFTLPFHTFVQTAFAPVGDLPFAHLFLLFRPRPTDGKGGGRREAKAEGGLLPPLSLLGAHLLLMSETALCSLYYYFVVVAVRSPPRCAIAQTLFSLPRCRSPRNFGRPIEKLIGSRKNGICIKYHVVENPTLEFSESNQLRKKKNFAECARMGGKVILLPYKFLANSDSQNPHTSNSAAVKNDVMIRKVLWRTKDEETERGNSRYALLPFAPCISPPVVCLSVSGQAEFAAETFYSLLRPREQRTFLTHVLRLERR